MESCQLLSVAFVKAPEVRERERGLYPAGAVGFDDVPEDVAEKEQTGVRMGDDVVDVVRIEILHDGNDGTAVGERCDADRCPPRVVPSHDGHFVVLFQTACVEKHVQFGYLLGHLEIGEGLLFEVVGERGQLPVLPEALLVYLDKVFLHHKRIRLNDKVRIKKT